MSSWGSSTFGRFNPLSSIGPTTSFGAATSTHIVPIIAVIVGITLIVLVIFVAIQMRKYYPTIALKGPVDLYDPSSPVIVDRPTTTGQMSATYTLSFYVYMDAVPDMRVEATPLLKWPGAWNINYNPAQEVLIWDVYPTPDSTDRGNKTDIISLPNVPLQRWMQVTASFEGRSFDFYMNGSLVRSHILTNLPPAVNASIILVPGGIRGQIAYAQVWPRRLTVNEVRNNYQDTSDSQGRPYLGPDFMKSLTNIAIPNLFCPSGNCAGTNPAATPSQTWEFPYA
jgi:hypothetical protein